MKVAIGQTVSWVSQSQGREIQKTGNVAVVVPAGEWPHPLISDGLPRNHESYIIKVSPKKGKAKPKLYWPRVSALREAQ